MNRLQGNVAIVTGGSRGIGAAIAKRLARDGAKVVVNYSQNGDSADQVVTQIRAAEGNAIAVQADIRDSSQVDALFAQTMAHYGRLDILVNNAGLAEFVPLDRIDETHFLQIMQVNVWGVLLATQQAVRHIGPEGGRIIHITSGAAEAASPGTSVYSASKAAVQTLSKSWAAELGPRHITVNCVSPGITETDMLRAVIPAEIQQAMIANTALRRIGQPEDIADVVAFLASEDACWVTGQVIGANGGLR